MTNDETVRIEGFDGGGRMVEVDLSVSSVVAQLAEQGVRVIVMPELPDGAQDNLALRQQIAVAALAYHRKIGLQEASDAMSGIQNTAFDAVKKVLHQKPQKPQKYGEG